MSAPPLVILLIKLQFASLSLYNTCRPDIHHNLMSYSWDKFSKWPWKITQPHSSFFWLLVLWPNTPHQAQSVIYHTVTISHCYSSTSTILPHKLGSEILPKSWMSQGRKKPMRNWSSRVGDIWDDKTGNRCNKITRVMTPDTDGMHNSERAANTEDYFGSPWICKDRKLQTGGKEKVNLLFWQMFPTLSVALAWVTATERWKW
jgi:hypothetical protein